MLCPNCKKKLKIFTVAIEGDNTVTIHEGDKVRYRGTMGRDGKSIVGRNSEWASRFATSTRRWLARSPRCGSYCPASRIP